MSRVRVVEELNLKMNFSDKFKKWYWFGLLIILTALCGWRLYVGHFLNFDIYLFLIWFIAVLFPIISEISIFGLNVKKDIEIAKNEIKGYIADIKNNNNFQPIINVSSAPVDPKEYEEKTRKEVLQGIESEEEAIGTVKNDNTVEERLQKIKTVEEFVNQKLYKLYGDNYKPQIKIENEVSKRKLILDGAIYENDEIIEVVEIKFITKISFESFYFIALNFLKKIYNFGFRDPIKIKMIVVSESLDERVALSIAKDILKLNYNRKFGLDAPHIDIETYTFKSGQLSELKTKSEEPHEKVQ